ncbi:MAG: V-type ATP synthase subunit D [Candidatus Jacksonbacteria bacterium]
MLNVNPTRMELLRLKRKLKTAQRGHKLLKEKRDGLMKEFMVIIREAKAARQKIEEILSQAFRAFLFAKADLGKETVEEALMSPTKKISLTASQKNIMSVKIPEFELHEKGDHFCYSFLSTTSDIDYSLKTFSEALKDLVKLAEIEHSARLLSYEIEKTRRRVNALEYVFIPEMRQTSRYIEAKLAERERSEKVVLMKVKDIIEK